MTDAITAAALSHCVTIAVDVPADAAFAFLADPIRLGAFRAFQAQNPA